MKIIMHNVLKEFDAIKCYDAVRVAIKYGIKEGRHNFMSFHYTHGNKYISVVRNKNSYTTRIEEGE